MYLPLVDFSAYASEHLFRFIFVESTEVHQFKKKRDEESERQFFKNYLVLLYLENTFKVNVFSLRH